LLRVFCVGAVEREAFDVIGVVWVLDLDLALGWSLMEKVEEYQL
jgi:hypothetical protein